MMRILVEDLRARLRARAEQKREEFATRTIHLLERPLPAGTILEIGPQRHTVDRESYLVVIDEAPGAYWCHPVRYELHDVETGEVHTIHAQYPLKNAELNEGLRPIHIPNLPWLKKKAEEEDFRRALPLDLAKLEKLFGSVSFGVPLAAASTRHALFITGDDNMPDFHNDFVMMRQILLDRYGYDPANILIAMGDGTGYADLPVDFAGDHAGIDAAFNTFAAGGAHALGPGDTLFLYTFDHGGADAGGSFLCLPADAKYYDTEMRAKLDTIHCGQLIVAMNQCQSGGFIADVTATTGPASVAIFTACRADQFAYPAGGGGSHGYFSVALATALNWAFPAAVGVTFPGWAAGDVTAQDTTGDGLVSAEEAFQYTQSMMNLHHDPTILGFETPQWGVSAAGAGATLFWGLPDVRVEDGVPMWESPDLYLHDPAVVPTDTTALPGDPANWSDYYHPDVVNRIVARVHNAGCAPARNVSVEFRTMTFGAGGGITLAGTSLPITNIDPGHHDYGWTDWNFSSALIHRCAMARAVCAGDPALPFDMTNIATDDNQAQRNLDPLFAGFSDDAQVIAQKFTIRNVLQREAAFEIVVPEEIRAAKAIRPVLDADRLRKIALKPGETKEIDVRFEIAPKTKLGERLRLPLEMRDAEGRIVGGMTFTVEVAIGRLEGLVVNRNNAVPKHGSVLIENTKQPNVRYRTALTARGRFSFVNITPGPYRIIGDCGSYLGTGSVFVEPNGVTRKVLAVELVGERIREQLEVPTERVRHYEPVRV